MSHQRDLPVPLAPSAPMPAYGYSAIPQQYAHPGLSLAQLWAMVWAHRKLTAAVVFGALVIGAVATKLMSKTFQATATLMVDYEVNDPLGGREFPVGLMGSYIATQIQLIKSPAVMLPVIEKLGLETNPDYVEGYSGSPDMLQEWLRSQLIKELAVEQGEWGSQLIYITYSTDSAQEAARVANAVADVYSEQQFRRLNGPATERTQRFTQQINQLKQDVEAAQEKLTAFRQKTGLLDSDTRIDLEMQRLSDLEGRLAEAQNQRRMVSLRQMGDPNLRDSTLGADSVQALRSALAQQQTQMAQLSTTVGPRHPQLLELQSQIDATRRALDAETQVYTGNTQTQVSAARSLERQLERAVEEARQAVLEKRKVQDESAKYERELATAQTLYQQALDGYNQAGRASGGYNNIHFVSRASPPVKASKPKPIVNMVMALMAGLFLGVAGPLAYELFNRRVRCRDDIDRDFGIPVLAEFEPIHFRSPALSGAL